MHTITSKTALVTEVSSGIGRIDFVNTSLKKHPTVEAYRRKAVPEKTCEALDAAWLRQLCLDAGADDVGCVAIDWPALAEERRHMLRVFPHASRLARFVPPMYRM